jgi:DNA-binding GntR family transcriptional regulator
MVRHMGKRSEVKPFWWTIRTEVHARIVSGEYHHNFLISEVDLAKEYQTTRTTVRKAIKWLRDRGLIETIPGVGSHSIYKGEPTSKET